MDWCCILRLVVSLQYVQNMGLGFALYFLSPLLAHSRLFHLVLGAAIGIVCSIALLLYQLYKQSQSTLRLLPGASFLQSASVLTTLAFPVTGLMLLPTLYSLLQWALGLLFTFWSSDQVFGVPHLGKFYFVFFGAVGMAFVWWFQWWAPPNAQDYATSSFQQPNDDDGDDDDVVVWRDLRRMEAEVRLHDLRLPDNQQRLARTLQLVAIMLLFQSTSSTLISTVVVAVALLWSVLEAVYAHLYFWYWSETPGLHSTLISTDEYVAQGKTETEKALAALRQHLKDHPTVAESVREDHEVRLRRFMHGKDHMDATGKAKKDASQRSKAGARRWWGDVVANDVQRRLDEAEAQLREEAKLIDRLTRENQSKQEHIQSMEAAMANEIEKHDAIMQVFKDRELTQKQDAEHCIEVSANANATETNQSHNDEIHAMRVDMFNHKMALEQSLQELDAQYLKKAFNAMADESKVDVFVCSVFVTSELKDEAKTLRSLYDQTQYAWTLVLMKLPDEALLRGRSKAPLDDVEVLYLSGCALDGLANLDACVRLHSLHVAHNRLVDITGLRSLRTLWHINLSYNPRLHDLSPLADFPALGFLSLEHGTFTFDDVAVLRDMHIADLRLRGNPALMLVVGQDADKDVSTYRLKTVALLPNVWALDGHYITTDHRLVALDTFGEFEYATTQGRTDRYGSTAMTWQLLLPPSNPLADHLVHLVNHEPTSHRILRESYRLKALLHMYNHLSTHANAHLYLAPKSSAAAGGSKPWPVVPADDILRMPPRARLNLAILLAATLDFPSLPPFLLLEATTINLVGHLDPANIRAILDAPPYVATALLFCLGEQGLKDNLSLPENDRKLWSSLPVVLSTFVDAKSIDFMDPITDDQTQLFTRRCCYAVILLSRAPSFPTHGVDTSSSVASAVATALQPLLDKAKMRVQDLFPDAAGGMSAWIGSQKRLDGIRSGHPGQLPWNKPSNDRTNGSIKYPRPWATPAIAANHDSNEDEPGNLNPLEPQQAPSEPTRTLLPTTNSMNLHSRSSPQLLHDASSVKRAKLHRDAHGYHKEGVPRAFGVPNMDLSAQEVIAATAAVSMGNPSLHRSASKPVELFATNATWNANYVLAPPALVHAQNVWMDKNQQQTDGWSRMGDLPTHSIDATTHLVAQSRPLGPTRARAVMHVTTSHVRKESIMVENEEDGNQPHDEAQQVRHDNDGQMMQLLQRDLAMLLGKAPATTDDTPSRSCFMTQSSYHPKLLPSATRNQEISSTISQPRVSPFQLDMAPVTTATAAKPVKKAGFKTW
ncbi:hypothetical protein DYB25_000757 [Aphanomyces astaci]|uniref:Uncharacterized protein n=2 Tax=Aphanomyces astaci TaxID=112090 RepID=A0A397C1T8_APHAT|nr:hypothetical protein DYB25_000757 [Aphanomyces astaci]